jgi:N,N'-diacetyllegionaminate synthase
MKIGSHDLDQRTFIIAEIGNNHEGDFGLAQKMIQSAAECGVDAVKFQTIVPDRLVSSSDTARLAQLERFRFSYEQFAALADVAQSAGVAFLSTPFDIESVAALNPFVPAFKIASGDNDFFALLTAVAKTGKPIIMSGGLADIDLLRRSQAHVESIWRAENIDGDLAILHCVVAYPTAAENATLCAIRDIAQLGCVVGYSDHTIGTDAAVLSVALGARIIEKHFTIDKNQSEFRDHKLSADPADMAQLVRNVRLAETLIGRGGKRVLDCEAQVLRAVRRGIVAVRDLQAGAVVDEEDLSWVRPREGLAPGNESALVGRKLVVDIRRGMPILPEHLI